MSVHCFVFQSRGGGTSLATAVLEDEVLAEQGEEASLLSGCRALLRSVTKVSLAQPQPFLGSLARERCGRVWEPLYGNFHSLHFYFIWKASIIEFLKFFEPQYMRQTKQCIVRMKFLLKV